jgi:hypothetical protein
MREFTLLVTVHCYDASASEAAEALAEYQDTFLTKRGEVEIVGVQVVPE